MKESLAKLDKRLLLRETFTDEQSVRANGGVPTNVVFEKGVGRFNPSSASASDSIIIPFKKTSGVYSIRIKYKQLTDLNNRMLVDLRNATTTTSCYLQLNITTAVLYTGARSSSLYMDGNGISDNLIKASVGVSHEVVFVTNNLPIGQITLANNYAFSAANNISIELFEIYEGTLTAQEVKNLYENKRYKQLMPHGEILGPELIVNGGFDSNSTWIRINAEIANNTCILTGTGSGSTSYITQGSGIFVAGRRYNVSLNIRRISGSGSIQVWLGTTSQVAITATNEWSKVSLSLIHSGSGGLYIINNNVLQTLEVDNISVKEVLSNITPILDVDAFDGVIKNRLSGGCLNTTNLILNGTFSSTSNWGIGDGTASIANGTLNFINSSIWVQQTGALVVGKTYQLTYSITSYTSGSIKVDTSVGIISRSSLGTFSESFTAISTVFAFRSASFTGSIDNVIIQEVIPTVIPTAVQVVKDGGVNVMRFNGSTSKIDCGSYNGLTGDITISCWVKQSKYRSLPDTIFSNGKVKLRGSFSSQVVFSSDGGTTGLSIISGLKLQNYFNIVIIRKSSGLTTAYINGVINVNEITSGTPANGNSNMTIGDDAGLSRFFDGTIAQLQIFSGIMSQAEISQLYTSQRSKYNI